MRWRLRGACVYFCLAVGAVPVWAQSPPATLEERPAALGRTLVAQCWALIPLDSR